jgi:hypothetical protein
VYTLFTITNIVSIWLTFSWHDKAPYPETIEDWLVFKQKRLAALDKW